MPVRRLIALRSTVHVSFKLKITLATHKTETAKWAAFEGCRSSGISAGIKLTIPLYALLLPRAHNRGEEIQKASAPSALDNDVTSCVAAREHVATRRGDGNRRSLVFHQRVATNLQHFRRLFELFAAQRHLPPALVRDGAAPHRQQHMIPDFNIGMLHKLPTDAVVNARSGTDTVTAQSTQS